MWVTNLKDTSTENRQLDKKTTEMLNFISTNGRLGQGRRSRYGICLNIIARGHMKIFLDPDYKHSLQGIYRFGLFFPTNMPVFPHNVKVS